MYPSNITWDVFPLYDGSTGFGSVSMTVKNQHGYEVPAFALIQNHNRVWHLMVWSRIKQRHVSIDLSISVGKSEKEPLCFRNVIEAKMTLEAIIGTWGAVLLANY